MATFTLQYRVGLVSPPRKRRSSAAVWAIVAIFSTLGAIAADVAYRKNAGRVSRYHEDALCSVPLVAPASSSGSVCSIDVARVLERKVRSRSHSRVFSVTLRTSDGAAESVVLKGMDGRRLWDATRIGASVYVQRFTEANQTHITTIRSNRLQAPTEWNPGWREHDMLTGTVFLSAVALVSIIGLTIVRAKARRDG